MENFSLGLQQLYAKVLANATEDIELAHFTQRLATYNLMHLWEKIIWEGTEH
jgi:hypothetical protein